MAPAFVNTPISVTSRTAFTGASVTCLPKTCNTTATTMSVSGDNQMTRRQALLAGAALVAGAVPLAALAKSGMGPNQSIFGLGGPSSPFVGGLQTGGKVLYTRFSDDEIQVFKRIIEDSRDRIVSCSDAIKTKSWEDIRGRIRLEANELRSSQVKITESIADKDIAKKAEKAFNTLKYDMEQFDQACVQKNQDLSFKKYNLVVKDIDDWISIVGL